MDHNIKMILSRNTKCLNTFKMCVDSQQHCPSDRLWLFLWSFGALVFQVIEFSSFLFVCFLIEMFSQIYASVYQFVCSVPLLVPTSSFSV